MTTSTEEIKKVKEAAQTILDYFIDREPGTMPEPVKEACMQHMLTCGKEGVQSFRFMLDKLAKLTPPH